MRSSVRKFYGRYGDLIKQYEVPLSRMLHDILDDDHLQWHPPLIRHYTNFWPYYWSWPYYRIWFFYLIARGFHRTFATGAACQQRTLTPPDTWSCPTLGLASVLMLRLISPELVLFLDFWVSNIPRYVCFCLTTARQTDNQDYSNMLQIVSMLGHKLKKNFLCETYIHALPPFGRHEIITFKSNVKLYQWSENEKLKKYILGTYSPKTEIAKWFNLWHRRFCSFHNMSHFGFLI